MNIVEIVDEIRGARLGMDKLMNETFRMKTDARKSLKDNRGFAIAVVPLHEAINSAYIAARMAKAWSGKALGMINDLSSPYYEVDKASKIPPEADKSEGNIYCRKCDCHDLDTVLMACNSLRAYANTIIKKLDQNLSSIKNPTEDWERFLWESYTYLHEARSYLGFALGALRGISKGESK